MWAVIKKNKEIIEALLKAKVDVNSSDDEGRTPLMWAVKNKDKDIIEALLKAKADINAVDKKGNSVLYYAVYTDNPDNNIIELLINNGLDIKKANILSGIFFEYYQINPN